MHKGERVLKFSSCDVLSVEYAKCVRAGQVYVAPVQYRAKAACKYVLRVYWGLTHRGES